MDSEDSQEAGDVNRRRSSSSSSSGSGRRSSSRGDSRPGTPSSVNGARSDNKQTSENNGEQFRPASPEGSKNSNGEAPKSPSSMASSPRRILSPAGSPASLSQHHSNSPGFCQSPSSPRKSPEKESDRQNWSPKSNSRSRQDSRSPSHSVKSDKSDHSRKARLRSRSDSSRSSRESSPETRNAPGRDPVTEQISDGEMESDQERNKSKSNSPKAVKSPRREKKLSESNKLNISHEDLSDVSDLDSMGPPSEDEKKAVKKSPIRAPDQSDSRESSRRSEPKIINGNARSMNSSPQILSNGLQADPPKIDKIPQEKTSKTEDPEEQLDFEAEEGECVEAPPKQSHDGNNVEGESKDDEGSGAASSLEEGEVSDEEERRPEETEPRPVCRFYSRGQCTWGISCRFLHPGVTDKGNYTMFDMVRAMPAGYGHHPHHHAGPPHHHHPLAAHHHPHHALASAGAAAASHMPPPESAWERGLRTAKEMMRKANKRKEQDSDFEEKKMHLSLSGGPEVRGGPLGVGGGDEDDPDLAAYIGSYLPRERSPSPVLVKREREEFYRQVDRRAAYRERYREVSGPPLSPPHHRAPPESVPAYYKQDKMDDRERGVPPSGHHKSRRGRTTREVIVQRAPGGHSHASHGGRADEWADPWMRGGGAGAAASTQRGGDKHTRSARRYPHNKYSSASSYSSSSSHSSNSSARSGSPRNVPRHGAATKPQRLAALSPSVIVQERRAANARAIAMNPPAPSARKRAPSPAAARQHAANPPPPHHSKSGVDAFGRTKPGKGKSMPWKRHAKSSTSGSDSSSSSSDSESESSSSSDSSPARAPAPPPPAHRAPPPPAERKQPTAATGKGRPAASPKQHAAPVAQKKDVQDQEIRKEAISKKRVATSPIANMVPSKKPVSRREELLKQLKAVEDAIARKRSKC